MFTKDIGIDLGTANTLVYMRGKDIIIREPSVVAVDVKYQRVRYVGQEAKEVIGRTPGSIIAVRPLKDGVIADFDMTTRTLEELISIANEKSGYIRAMWCGDVECEMKLKEEADVSSRCIPFGEEAFGDKCVCCGRAAKKLVYWGKAY